jgi:hypothetical protein
MVMSDKQQQLNNKMISKLLDIFRYDKTTQSKQEMNYPAASHEVSKARQQHENHLEASFEVWTRGAIKGLKFCIQQDKVEEAVKSPYIGFSR